MNSTLRILACFLLLYTLGVACSDEEGKPNSTTDNTIQRPLNPNGDSELAILMRTMFDDLEQLKQQIAKGDSTTLSFNHEKILTANGTEPKKVASKKYKDFAAAYLQILKSLETDNPAQRLDTYNSLVNNCMTCHQSLCPGPIVKIKKLL